MDPTYITNIILHLITGVEGKSCFFSCEDSRENKTNGFPDTSNYCLVIERFSIECRKTKTKPITNQLDFSPNLKPQ